MEIKHVRVDDSLVTNLLLFYFIFFFDRYIEPSKLLLMCSLYVYIAMSYKPFDNTRQFLLIFNETELKITRRKIKKVQKSSTSI